MPTIRFLREGRDVPCQEGETIREVALRERIELYGLKGKLGNCGGYGRCITCYVSIEGGEKDALSPITELEQTMLRSRPMQWRLSCQACIHSSAIVLTRPQSPPTNLENLKKEAAQKILPT